jgi:putative membrane protein
MGRQRNQFDRLVHFLYGLLLAYPLREIYRQVADARGFWDYFLQLDVTVTRSAMYEMVEWLAAVMYGGELGVAYLGTQCDVRDAQKDMLMAGLGAALAMSITAAINIRFQRDFAREWQESLRVKIPAPLGEDEAERMLRDKPGGGA